MNSETELLKALNQLTTTPDPVIEYRWYYDDSGDIIACSMQGDLDIPNYIVVAQEIYEFYHRYRVVNNKIKLIEHNLGVKPSLIRHTRGFAVVKNNASLLLEDGEEYEEIEYYDSRND